MRDEATLARIFYGKPVPRGSLGSLPRALQGNTRAAARPPQKKGTPLRVTVDEAAIARTLYGDAASLIARCGGRR